MRLGRDDPGPVRYEWWHAGAGKAFGRRCRRATLPGPAAEETFISEHYWGYARQPDGSTVEYGVEHPPWRVWRCEDAALSCRAELLYGERFAACLAGPRRRRPSWPTARRS